MAACCVGVLPALGDAGHADQPKNGKILFERGTFFPTEAVRIYSISPSGGTPKPLTPAGAFSSGSPDVSPNGKVVAFDSDRPGGVATQVFLMTIAGKHEHPITHGASPSLSATWAPDGKHLAFAGNRKGVATLFVMKANGTHQRTLTKLGPSTFSDEWSPDGKLIAFMSDHGGDFNVWTIHPDGTHRRQITHDPAFDGDPSFSPNGKKIIFDSSRTGGVDIYRMNRNGSHVRRITHGAANENDPVYSPDGRSIAYSVGNNIAVAAKNGSHRQVLTTSPSADFGVTWAPRP